MIMDKSRWLAGIIGITFATSSCLIFAKEPDTSSIETNKISSQENSKENTIGRFEISRFNVTGNTLLTEQEVSQLLAPFEGKDQDFTAIQKAVEVLEKAYHDKGFNIVRVVVPEQELSQGVVQLKVIETHIGKVSATGNKFFDEGNIRRSLPEIREGETPDIARLSKSLKVANENPAKKTVVQLQTGAEEQTVDAVLQVKDQKPWTAGVSIDNTGDVQTGRNRITAMYQHSNIADLDHVLSAQYITSISKPSKVRVYGLGYHIPLYSIGDSVDFFGSYSTVDSGTINAGTFYFWVSGCGSIFGVRYNHNFAKIDGYDATLYAELDQKAYRNNISLFDIPLGNKVTVHPISLTYAGNWGIARNTLNFYMSGTHNFSGGRHGRDEDFNAARFEANPNFNVIRYGGTYAHAFTNDWQIRVVLNGQYTKDTLVQEEQFGIGGASSVRGFYEREVSDDKGYSTNLELYTPELCSANRQCRLLGFFDTGSLSRNDALPGEPTNTYIASIGVGFRVNINPQWILRGDYAHVTHGTGLNPSSSNRAHFRVAVLF